jgi:hypothetical protein
MGRNRNLGCIVAGGLLVLLLAPEARAQQPQEATDLLMALIRVRSPAVESIAARPGIAAAVAAQNASDLSDEEVQKRDREWQAAGGKITPLKESLQLEGIGRVLRAYIERGDRFYTEALLMDQRGALVGAFPAPSDYWQGDEDKFTQPFATGQTYVGPIHFDHSTRAYVSDVCAAVFEDGGSAQIGVLCMAVRLSKGPGVPPDVRHE